MGDPIITVGFPSQSPEHLSLLLERAKTLLSEGSPSALRMAGMCVLDYHQLILREAAEKAKVDLAHEDDPAKMLSRIRTHIGGLEKASLDHLSKFRGSVYHHPERMPAKEYLLKQLENAPGRHALLEKAIQTAVERERVMSRMAQLLRAHAEELRRLGRSYSPRWHEQWDPKIDRSIRIAETSPMHIGEEGIVLLVDLAREIGSAEAWNAQNSPPEPEENEFDGYPSEPDGFEPPEVQETEEAPDVSDSPEEFEYDPSEFYPQEDDSTQDPYPEEPPEDSGPDDSPEPDDENTLPEEDDPPADDSP